MKITYGTMLMGAACMASGLWMTGCAGPSTRVLPRESSSAYEVLLEETPVIEEVNPFYMQEELNILTSASRYSGSRGESDAARYIQQLLRDYGYEVNRQRFRYGKPDGTFITGTNVEAVRRASSEEADILIVSTHHDSAAGSPGAVANASGVVVWLETARLVSRLPTDTEVRFVSVSGSEEGWIGARHYVESMSEKERSRVIGNVEIDALGYVSDNQIVLGTPDGKATMLGDMIKSTVRNVLGENWQYEVMQQKNYLAFTRGEMPSFCLTQAREAYEAGTPLDVAGTVDIERVYQAANVMTQTVSGIMSTDTPSMLAKSRFMNDLRDDAYIRTRDEAAGFGDTLEQVEHRLGLEGRKQSDNTDSAGRKMECYEYRMKWFDVDQLLLTDYYYVDGKLDTITIDGDGAGVEFEEMKERLTSWYGRVDSESEGPSGMEYGWEDPVRRIKVKLIPGGDGYEVELQGYEPKRKILGEFVWNADSKNFEIADIFERADGQKQESAKRINTLLKKISNIYPETVAEQISRISVYTDGIGASDGYMNSLDDDVDGGGENHSRNTGNGTGGSDSTGTGMWECGIDLEDALTEDASWRDETASDKLLVHLYGELLAQKNPNGIAEAFARQFPAEPVDEAVRAETGLKPGEITETAQELPDFADSFMLFVLTRQPENQTGEWNRRIQFFYGFEKMTAYRSQVQKQLMQSTWMQEGFTAE